MPVETPSASMGHFLPHSIVLLPPDEKNAERKGQLEKKAEEVMKRMEQIDEYLSNGSSEGSGAGGTVQRFVSWTGIVFLGLATR